MPGRPEGAPARPAAPEPVFVLGAPGMEAETVAAALGQHPACLGLPEINLELGGNLDQLLKTLMGLRSAQMHGLLRALGQLLAGEQSIASVEMARRWLMRHLHLPTSAVWQLLQQRIAPRRIVAPVTASLFETASLRRLAETFPQARFVALQMHPMSFGQAVIGQNGALAAWALGAVDEEVQPPQAEPARLWELYRAGQEELQTMVSPDRFRQAKLEDLLHRPADSLAHLAAWAGLPVDKAAIAAMRRPEASVFRGPGPVGAHSGGQIAALGTLAGRIPDWPGLGLSGRAPWRDDGLPLPRAVRDAARAQGYG